MMRCLRLFGLVTLVALASSSMAAASPIRYVLSVTNQAAIDSHFAQDPALTETGTVTVTTDNFVGLESFWAGDPRVEVSGFRGVPLISLEFGAASANGIPWDYVTLLLGFEDRDTRVITGYRFFGFAFPVPTEADWFQTYHSTGVFVSDPTLLYYPQTATLTITDLGGTTPSTVPEPASMVLLGSGLVGIAGRAWRKRKA